jgi:mannose-1-phosphate guanylyltransferase
MFLIGNVYSNTEKYLKNTYDIISEITADYDYHDLLNKRYLEIQSVSIDYGILEKASEIYTIPCDFGWDDVGSWHSVERYREKDSDENIFEGKVTNIDSNNNMVFINSKPVVIAGLDNIFMVENDDIIFIGSKDQIVNIKEIKQSPIFVSIPFYLFLFKRFWL